VAGLAGSASAAEKSTLIQGLAKAAETATAAGDFARAGDLYLEIWHADGTQQVALYNAARAHQLAGKKDQAITEFRELLALEKLDPALKKKGDKQMAVLVPPSKAEASAEVARKAAAERLAAESVAAEKARVEKAASERAAAQKAEAERAAASQAAADRVMAEQAEAERLAVARKARSRPKAPVVVKESPVDQPSSGAVPWLVTGGVAVVAALAVGVWAQTDASELSQDLGVTSGGYISGTNYNEAKGRIASIDTRAYVAGGLGAVGVALAVVGVVKGATGKQVALTPSMDGRGMVAAWRF